VKIRDTARDIEEVQLYGGREELVEVVVFFGSCPARSTLA
jgi:hypothetical protein